MSDPRNQHYVPQSYLMNFVLEEHKKEQLYVLPVSGGKIFQTNIRNIASEKDFYTIDHLDNKYIWEKKYSKIVEPLLIEQIRKCRGKCEDPRIQSGTLVLSPDDKAWLSLSIICQLLRGKQTREYEKQVYHRELSLIKKVPKVLSKSLNDETVQRLLGALEKNEDVFKEVSIPLHFDTARISKYVRILMKYSFIFIRITGNSSFVTSDNPVMLVNSSTADATPFANGLKNRHTVLFFPLSPKLLLGAYHPSMCGRRLNGVDGTLKILSSDNESSFTLFHNMKQKEQCNRFVFSPSKDVLEQIQAR